MSVTENVSNQKSTYIKCEKNVKKRWFKVNNIKVAHRCVEIEQMYKWGYNNHNYLFGIK